MSETPEAYLNSLSDEQRDAALTTDVPITILAGAGSGKTRTLVGRFIHLVTPKEKGGQGADPNSIMMVTFTNKAGREMRERLLPVLEQMRERDKSFPQGEPWIGTFHGLSLRILRIEAKHAGLGENFSIFDESDARALASEVADQMGLASFDVDDFFRDLEYAKARLYTPQMLAERQIEVEEALEDGGAANDRLLAWSRILHHFETENFPIVYGAYQRALNEQNAVDFSDLMNHVTRLFQDSEKVRLSWQSTFRHFMIDEAQDLNMAQIRWLDVITNNGRKIEPPKDIDGSHYANAADGLNEVNTFRLKQTPKATVAFVGDDDQAIYGFRGSDVAAMRALGKRYEGLELRYLKQSYRCQPAILRLANGLVSNNITRFDKEVVAADAARARRPIAIEKHVTPENEIERIVVAARAHIADGGDAKQFAVLTRTRDLAKAVARGIRAAGLPVVEGRASDLRKTAEIRDVMAYLGFIVNPDAETLLRRIANKPARGMGMSSMARVSENARLKNISFINELRTIMNDRVDLPEGAKAYPKAFARAAKEFGRQVVGMRDVASNTEGADRAIFQILEMSGYLPNLKDQALKAAGLSREEIDFFDEEPRVFLTELIRFDDEAKNRKGRRDDVETLDGEDLADRAGQLSETGRRIGNIALLLEQAATAETLDDFVQEAILDMDQVKPADGIQVMTVHGSKGLEFDRVFLPFWIDGIFPHGRAIDEGDKEIEEERRLAYVAITRAREEVRISHSWSIRNCPFVRQRDSARSRFVSEISGLGRDTVTFREFNSREKSAYTLAGAARMPEGCIMATPSEDDEVDQMQRDLELANEQQRRAAAREAALEARQDRAAPAGDRQSGAIADFFNRSSDSGTMPEPPPFEQIPLDAYEQDLREELDPDDFIPEI